MNGRVYMLQGNIGHVNRQVEILIKVRVYHIVQGLGLREIFKQSLMIIICDYHTNTLMNQLAFFRPTGELVEERKLSHD